MNNYDLAKTVKEHAQNIRRIVQGCSTESVVRNCMVRSMADYLPFGELTSPAKQMRFLLGLLLESEEPEDAQEFGISHWQDVVASLVAAFSAYSWSHSSEGGSTARRSSQEIKKHETAIMAFVDYFEKTTLAFTEQTAQRIKLYLAPFDDQLSKDLGLSSSEALTIAEWIANSAQDRLDEVLEKDRDDELDLIGWAGGGYHAQSSIISRDKVMASSVVELLENIGKVFRSELICRYGETGRKFWDVFAIGRGEGGRIDFPTEGSIVERMPLIRLSDDVAMLFSLETLYDAILLQGEECLSNGPLRERYFKTRDRTLENQVESELLRILGNKARAYRNLYETPNRQYEHDLIILSDEICLFVEAKASPPVEPFRDPIKAYVRLHDHFHSNKGIQKSYSQAVRLLECLRTSGPLTLYNQSGEVALQLPSEVAEHTFCVCVTRDSFGPLATFLSLLLQKKCDNPFPWAVNILDLENIAEAWEYFSWDERQLKNYLSQRLPLNDTVVSDDELDYVGAYIQHCGLNSFSQSHSDRILLAPTYSNIIDRIHFHLTQGTPHVSIRPENPANLDILASMRVGKPVLVKDIPLGPIKVGRNENCPCESGVKFKYCHGT